MDTEERNSVNIVETEDETDKKCPQCGGVMDFDPASGNLKCPFCDYEETIQREESVPERAQEMDFYAAEHTANCDWGVATKTVICEACGAESIYDALQTSAVCPFCGSNQVMDANDVDTIAPGGVVPFSITDKEASDQFKQWIRRKWFCPKLAKGSAKPDKFKGIYLPYWTFDAETRTAYQGEYGIDHVRRDKNGRTQTTTSWHHTSGTYQEFIDDELVLASEKHDRSMLRKLEPFDTANNKTYNPEYIAGFIAERYSIGLKDAWNFAASSIRSKLENHISQKIQAEHHADHARNIYMDTDFSDITYKYLLLPVWISHFKYKDKVYQFMVNGQTGQVAGKTPLSALRIVLAVLLVLAIIALVFWLD